MNQNRTTLERAFELAESGRCKNVTVIRAVLKSEGYGWRQLQGRSLSQQLVQIIQKARSQADLT